MYLGYKVQWFDDGRTYREIMTTVKLMNISSHILPLYMCVMRTPESTLIPPPKFDTEALTTVTVLCVRPQTSSSFLTRTLSPFNQRLPISLTLVHLLINFLLFSCMYLICFRSHCKWHHAGLFPHVWLISLDIVSSSKSSFQLHWFFSCGAVVSGINHCIILASASWVPPHKLFWEFSTRINFLSLTKSVYFH